MTEHRIKLKATELHKEENGKPMIGYKVRTRYEGPNKHGITREMAICAIGALLSAVNLDVDEVEKITSDLTKQIIDDGRGVAAGKTAEEAAARVDKKREDQIEKLTSTFFELITDPKWRKLIRHEVKFCESNYTQTRVIAWIAIVLHELKAHDKKGCEVLEDMFFDDVIKIKDDEE